MQTDLRPLTADEATAALRFLRVMEHDGEAYLAALNAIDPAQATVDTLRDLKATAGDWNDSRNNIAACLKTILNRIVATSQEGPLPPSWIDMISQMPEPEGVLLSRLRPRTNSRQGESVVSRIAVVWLIALVTGFYAGFVVRSVMAW
jgi:hypothetical protein